MLNNLQAKLLQKYIISQAIDFSDIKKLTSDSWIKIENKLNFYIVKNNFKIAKGKLKNKNGFIYCDFKAINNKKLKFKKDKIYIKLEKEITLQTPIIDFNDIKVILCNQKDIALAKMFIQDHIYLNIKEIL
jgi:uncharacterized protein YueI